MTEHKDRQFFGLFDRGEKLNVEGMTFESCTFAHSTFSMTKDIARRSVASNVYLKNCAVNECDIGPAILNNVSVEDLQTDALFIIWGALFNNVTLSGNIGKIKINQHVHFSDRAPEMQKPFDDFRNDFYSKIDWALDISAARFMYFEVRGIPARLFRLDPESQAVVTRERALAAGGRTRISDWNREWGFAIELFIGDGDQDMVLVAPLGARKAERDIAIRGLQELRDLGIAEPA